ncbi:gem-associated protein 5-like isoform X2 [Convolutriloba macropyga]|uniref:gem-associated protein 5-like isoform X2 n=1 Tax=Convolutriloba macropyga TaxID=536237 RepID=UPI003F527761
MTEFVFPPSINWNLPQISDSIEGLYVYAARNRVVIFKIDDYSPGYLKYLFQFDAHKDKIVALKCSHSLQSNDKIISLIATTGEDSFVRIWSLYEREAQLMMQHSAHKSKPTALAWKNESRINQSVVATGDQKGVVVLYSLSNQKYLYKPCDNTPVTDMQFAPVCQNPDLLAVAYRSGNLFLMDAAHGNLDVLSKIRPSDERIESVFWCPDIRREELDMSWIPNLITTSTDKLLRFYHVKVTSNAASDNDCSRVKSLFFKRLPSKGAAKRGKKDSDSYHDKLFFFGKWIAKEKILTGGANGDLISWTIDLNWERSMINSEGTSSVEKKVFVDFKVVDSGGHDSGHNKAIQSITCYNNSLVFTHAMDRYLCVWKLPEMKNVATLSTLGGSVFDLDISPVSKTWLAVASGGGFLHIWNSSLALQDSVELSAKLNDTRFKMMHVWQGYKTKVTVTRFHPSREGTVAFGTEDGRVGLYDVTNNKGSITSSSFHQSTVYALSFGPAQLGNTFSTSEVQNKDNDGPASDNVVQKTWYDIYSCGAEGRVLIHNPANLTHQAKDLNSVLSAISGKKVDEKRSTVCWSHAMVTLAVGNLSGTVDLYDVNLNHLAIVELHSSAIYHISWQHPGTISNEEHHVLAISCKHETNIKVVDVSKAVVIPPNDCEPRDVLVISNLLCQLTGHKKKIAKIEWSPHEVDNLISTSNDGSVQIWKVLYDGSYEFVCNYLQNPDACSSCAKFSLSDPDLVFSGGTDFILHCWRPSKVTTREPQMYRSTALMDVGNSVVSSEIETGTDLNGNLLPEKGDERAKSGLDDIKEASKDSCSFENIRGTNFKPASGNEVPKVIDDTPNAAGDACSGNRATHARRPKLKTFLKKLSNNPRAAQSVQETKELLDLKLQQSSTESQSESGESSFKNIDGQCSYAMFCGAVGAMKVLENETTFSMTSHDYENQIELLLLQGKIEAAIDIGIAKGCLNQKHVAASIMGGVKLWKKCVSGMVEQSLSNGDINDACQYMLMLNRVHDAMKLMVDHGKLRDAIVIGTLRLPPSDSYLRTVHESYAAQCEKAGNLEVAAQCYMTMNDYEKAARVLTSKNSAEANLLALEILLNQENQSIDRVEFLTNLCVIRLLADFNLERAQQVVANEKMQEFESIAFAIESFESFTKTFESCLNIQASHIRDSEHSSLFVCTNKDLEQGVDFEGHLGKFFAEFCNHLTLIVCSHNLENNDTVKNEIIFFEKILPGLTKLKSQAVVTNVSTPIQKAGKSFLVAMLDITALILLSRIENRSDPLLYSRSEDIMKEKILPLILIES